MEKFVSVLTPRSNRPSPNAADNCDPADVVQTNSDATPVTIPDEGDSEQEASSLNTPQETALRPNTSTGNAASNNDDQNPWPFIKGFFSYLGKQANGKSVYFQCLMCKPKFKKLSTSMMSTNNLKKHVASAHAHNSKKFQECIDSAKKSRKRQYSTFNMEGSDADTSSNSKSPSTFFQRQIYPRVTQEMYELKVSYLWQNFIVLLNRKETKMVTRMCHSDKARRCCK